MYSTSVKYIPARPELPVVVFCDQVEGSPEDTRIGRIDANRIIPLNPALSIGGLIPMPAAIPQKDSPGIEVIGNLLRSRRPKPVVLCSLLFVLHFSQIEVGRDSRAARILGHFIWYRHRQITTQHPADLPLFGSNECPVFERYR